MSDFPNSTSYHTHSSDKLIQRMNGMMQTSAFLFKKFKGVYAYDVDQNKYCDFSLSEGSCFRGHNLPALTHYIKNAISIGSDTEELTLLHYRLFRQLSTYFKNYHPSVYMHFGEALLSFVRYHKLQSINVVGQSLLKKVQFFLPSARSAEVGISTDLLIYEPLNFETDLSKTDCSTYKAKQTLCIESRTFSRIIPGKTATKDPNILICNTLSNGMSSTVLLSVAAIPGTTLPAPAALCISENLKYFQKCTFHTYLNHPLIPYQQGSIFKISSDIHPSNLLPYGIYLKTQTGYLSPEHSSYDLRRLKKALNAICSN